MVLGQDLIKALTDSHYLAIELNQIGVDHENEHLLSYLTLTKNGDAFLMAL